MALAVDTIPHDLFIGGAWVPGSTGKRLDVIDPSTEQVLATVADATVEDGLKAVAAASAAAPGWAATPPRDRAEILRRAFELTIARIDDLAELISRENGKTLADAKAELRYAAEFFRWYAEEAVRINGQLSVAPGGTNRILVQYQPVGVSVLVTPWNFPAAMATRKIGPALAAGCTCIVKPAAETPLTALALAQILTDAGAPPGVINVVTTSKAGPVVEAMLHDSRVRKLSFTGSTEVGRLLLKIAADRIVNCSMELGGNAPFIVFDDADLKDALDGAMLAKMRNGGEACTAANRFYVQRGIYDAFASGLAERMGALRVGSGYASDTSCGPLVNAATRDKVERLVTDAVAHGARVLIGGARLDGPGFFYPPTVLIDVPQNIAILREEIFGPVAVLVAFEAEEDAVAQANNTEFGLVSYVYSGDLTRALRVADRLEAGMVAINRGLVSDPAAPFGGVKESGLGREGAHEGLLAFLEAKYIAANW
jgi:succinate-semialdehyde dehydrogenase / glutarate-semialdehyde dehydrogenase